MKNSFFSLLLVFMWAWLGWLRVGWRGLGQAGVGPGLAVGGGANVALMNYGDLVLCSTNARFLWPFAKLGLSPELGSSVMLANIVGMPNAKKIMMLGEWLSADEAFRMGLVNEICTNA